jgi:syntaxin 5
MRIIEGSIQELQQTFQRALALITEQGEQVERITVNLDVVQVNLEAGHAQLQRYMRALSTNRELLLKLFAIMAVFLIIYFYFT